MGQILSTGWTLEQSDALKGFVLSGLSYSQSAEELNKRFGTSYSRSSAIGRANRIGLAAPAKPKTEPKPRAKKNRSGEHHAVTRIVRSNGNSNSMRVIRSVEVEQIKLRCVEIIPLGLSLIELEANNCRYPYGDETITFCGHPILAGSSYCSPHKNLCSEVPRPPRHKAFIREAA